MASVLGLSESLPSLVQSRYAAAEGVSALFLSPSEMAVIRTMSGIPFQLRFCPSLAKKPTSSTLDEAEKQSVSSKPPGHPNKDPFDNPRGHLFIANVRGRHTPRNAETGHTHVLILNKFPIIAHHFILATRDFKDQASPLEEDDVDVTYACLKAWGEGAGKRELFAFFNSGPSSGASQPHRHVQFLPVESIKDGSDTLGWDLLVDNLLDRDDMPRKLPLVYFARNIPKEPSPALLHSLYEELLETTARALCRDHQTKAEEAQVAGFSYNMAMTLSSMVLCPRVRGGVTLRRRDGSEVGYVALNGTLLGGTLMVKRLEEWMFLKESETALDELLAGVGVPANERPEFGDTSFC